MNNFLAEHVPLLWERMTMIYGHKWTSNYGVQDDGTWERGLADLTLKQIACGVKACLISGDEWPPTLPIFRMRCLPRAAFHQFAKRLPKPEADPAVRESALVEIYRILAKERST